MPAPAWENLDEFLSLDDFALSAVITDENGANPRTVAGIFDDPHMNAHLGEYDMDNAKPRLLCKETDLVGVERYFRVTVAGTAYEVLTGPQSTGDGMALLCLALLDP